MYTTLCSPVIVLLSLSSTKNPDSAARLGANRSREPKPQQVGLSHPSPSLATPHFNHCLIFIFISSQRVLNAAARVVTGSREFDRGLLDVPDRVFFKLAVTVHRCLNGRAPPYLSNYCVPVAGVDTRRHLRSANRQLLAVPRYRLNTYGCQAFSVAGPTAWNSLPDFIRERVPGCGAGD